MTLARLVVAALLLGSLSASAQVSKKGNQFSGGNLFSSDDWRPATTPSEPWKLIPKQPTDANSEKDPLDRIRTNDYKVSQSRNDKSVDILWPNVDPSIFDNSLKAQRETDTGCFSIRSYVVARDSQDSDSTHPVGYSTCVRSDRYHVKTTEIRSESADQ